MQMFRRGLCAWSRSCWPPVGVRAAADPRHQSSRRSTRRSSSASSQDQADREAIRSFLHNPSVKAVAAKAGVSADKAEAAVSTLQGDELRQAASQARAVNDRARRRLHDRHLDDDDHHRPADHHPHRRAEVTRGRRAPCGAGSSRPSRSARRPSCPRRPRRRRSAVPYLPADRRSLRRCRGGDGHALLGRSRRLSRMPSPPLVDRSAGGIRTAALVAERPAAARLDGGRGRRRRRRSGARSSAAAGR